MKQLLKRILALLHISVTRNQRYDAYTRQIIKQTLKPDSDCIDIGCHKGEILDLMIEGSPSGRKYGFEPIPELFHALTEKYHNDPSVTIFPTALYDKTGVTNFQHVLNAPAYSGIKKREYDGKHVHIEQISVKTDLLDNMIPPEANVRLIKIDVEGAEFQVIKGAKKTIQRCHPILIFEFGLGAADFYESKPEHLFQFISAECGQKISTLKGYLKGNPPLTDSEFKICFEKSTEYYFVAHN
ncbi:MAG: FkbM family methyltransferase [Bacteroidales bacterium]|nr:FkbM family methyltransferase [Bacteroidales bacterium]